MSLILHVQIYVGKNQESRTLNSNDYISQYQILSELHQNQPDAGNINMILAKFRQVLIEYHEI